MTLPGWDGERIGLENSVPDLTLSDTTVVWGWSIEEPGYRLARVEMTPAWSWVFGWSRIGYCLKVFCLARPLLCLILCLERIAFSCVLLLLFLWGFGVFFGGGVCARWHFSVASFFRIQSGIDEAKGKPKDLRAEVPSRSVFFPRFRIFGYFMQMSVVFSCTWRNREKHYYRFPWHPFISFDTRIGQVVVRVPWHT